MIEKIEFEIENHIYKTQEEREVDVVKTLHVLILPDNTEIVMDFSQYAFLTKQTVEKYILLNYPDRQNDIAPLDSDKIDTMYQNMIDDSLEDLMWEQDCDIDYNS